MDYIIGGIVGFFVGGIASAVYILVFGLRDARKVISRRRQ